MRRREFAKLIGGAAATWPYAVRAELTERVRRVGVLMGKAKMIREILRALPLLKLLRTVATART